MTVKNLFKNLLLLVLLLVGVYVLSVLARNLDTAGVQTTAASDLAKVQSLWAPDPAVKK